MPSLKTNDGEGGPWSHIHSIGVKKTLVIQNSAYLLVITDYGPSKLDRGKTPLIRYDTVYEFGPDRVGGKSILQDDVVLSSSEEEENVPRASSSRLTCFSNGARSPDRGIILLSGDDSSGEETALVNAGRNQALTARQGRSMEPDSDTGFGSLSDASVLGFNSGMNTIPHGIASVSSEDEEPSLEGLDKIHPGYEEVPYLKLKPSLGGSMDTSAAPVAPVVCDAAMAEEDTGAEATPTEVEGVNNIGTLKETGHKNAKRVPRRRKGVNRKTKKTQQTGPSHAPSNQPRYCCPFPACPSRKKEQTLVAGSFRYHLKFSNFHAGSTRAAAILAFKNKVWQTGGHVDMVKLAAQEAISKMELERTRARVSTRSEDRRGATYKLLRSGRIIFSASRD